MTTHIFDMLGVFFMHNAVWQQSGVSRQAAKRMLANLN